MIHCAGVQYNNLDEDNVLFKETKTDFGPFLIDFKDASPHQCQRCLTVREGDMCPQRWEFGCDELWYAAMDLQLWRPGVLYMIPLDCQLTWDLYCTAEIPFFNLSILEEHIGSAKDIVTIAKNWKVQKSDSDLWAKAEEIWARVDRWRKNDGIRPRKDAELLEREEEEMLEREKAELMERYDTGLTGERGGDKRA